MDVSGFPLMSAKQRSWIWLWLALSTLAGVLGAEIFRIANYNSTVPVIFHKIEVLNSPIHAGNPLAVRIWRDKTRNDCPVYSHRTAITVDGVAYELPSALWSGGPPETQFVDYAYPTLTMMPAGEYELRVHLVYNCPGFTYEIDQPSARFRVIDKG
jgi:hypothetical protein